MSNTIFFSKTPLACALAIAVVSPIACSSTSASPSDATDGSVTSDAGANDDGSSDQDAAADTNPCRAMENVGAVVHPTADETHPLPAATGGTIADGVYVVTSATQYELNATGQAVWLACGGELADFQETIRFQNGTIEEISNNVGDAAQIFGGTFTTSGTDLKMHLTCPTSGDATEGYSVIGSKLRLFGSTSTDSNGTCGPIVLELTPQ